MAADRVVCAKCGANNFATQAACWKCSAALAVGAAPSSKDRPSAAPAVSASALTPALREESPTAFWASMAMGAFFPGVGLIVGVVFLMLDDRRKTQIGWWNIAAGLVGSVVHTILTGWLAGAFLTPMLFKALGSMQEMRVRSSASAGLNDEVPNNLAGPGMPGPMPTPASTLFQNAPR